MDWLATAAGGASDTFGEAHMIGRSGTRAKRPKPRSRAEHEWTGGEPLIPDRPYGISIAWAPLSVPTSASRGGAKASGSGRSASGGGLGAAELNA